MSYQENPFVPQMLSPTAYEIGRFGRTPASHLTLTKLSNLLKPKAGLVPVQTNIVFRYWNPIQKRVQERILLVLPEHMK